MARLASLAKCGFVPIPPEAIELIVQRLRPGKTFTMLDPCAGEGLAIAQLRDALGCRPQDVYAVEIDHARSRALVEQLPGSHVLAPCSFFGTTSSRQVFSLVYCNPPFQEDMNGSGRVEEEFLRRATELLQPGGILAFVCPEHVADHWKFEQLIGTWYRRVSRFEFPDAIRRFGEVVTLAVKREKPSTERLSLCVEQVYDLPPARSIARWAKTMLTDDELSAALAASPLRKLLMAPLDEKLPEPPLALGQGHVALLLASGHLDGIVRPVGEPPHVVRGVATKHQYVASCDETTDDEGRTTEKVIMKERPVLTVRVLSADGVITTLKDSGADEASADPNGTLAKEPDDAEETD